MPKMLQQKENVFILFFTEYHWHCVNTNVTMVLYAKMTKYLGIFLNLQMFAIFRLIYLPIYHAFSIKLHIGISYIKPNPHIYYTHIVGVYKDKKKCCQIVEAKNGHRNVRLFFIMPNLRVADLR